MAERLFGGSAIEREPIVTDANLLLGYLDPGFFRADLDHVDDRRLDRQLAGAFEAMHARGLHRGAMSVRPSRHALAVVPPVSHEITDCIR